MKSDTRALHPPPRPATEVAPLTTPIYETTTYRFDSAAEVQRYAEGRSDKYLYSRYENPTVTAVESVIAGLEGAEAALVFSSGMAAATTTLMSLVASGNEVVCGSAIYGGTRHLLADLLSAFGVSTRFVGLEALANPEQVLHETTRLLWFESPVNPTLRCVDIEAVASACRMRGVVSVIDNTFACPLNQAPLALGIDICMHSATKYLNGHSDVTAGAIAGASELVAQVGRNRRLTGAVLDPYAAYALGRGLKTLSVRIARHNATALTVARFLEGDGRVRRVYYPGLVSHPDHALAARQMRGFGGVVCLELDGGLPRVSRFFDRLEIFARAASLGGVESLCSLPVLTSHWALSEQVLAQAGVVPGMARLSVGLEHPDDLVADLDQALG